LFEEIEDLEKSHVIISNLLRIKITKNI